ncbi:ciliary microtubule inner protein 2B [Aulostomus maculatus]
MEEYTPKISKVLMTPDPHYIPGYGGYCPQLKYRMGKSYGRLTAELLTSPEVKHSDRLVLRTSHDPSETAPTLRGIPEGHSRRMIPGYTGFIPKSQNYFACSYSEKCHKAFSEFYKEWQKSADLPAVADSTLLQSRRPKPTLTAISDKLIPYKSSKSFPPIGRTYYLDDDNPYKYFISGFTGHVPKNRFLFGKGYPVTTKEALIQFGKQQRGEHTCQDALNEQGSATPPIPSIYLSNRGVMPSFTGHIPGYKFMYGQTFGQLSQNALEKSGIKRILQTKP